MIRHDKLMPYSNEPKITGFIDFIKWNSLAWCRPNKAGLYYTSDSDGNVKKLHMSNLDDPICNLIFPGYPMVGKPVWSNGNELNNDDIVNVCSRYSVWYDIEDVRSYDKYGKYIDNRLVIITEEDEPVYWADFNEIVGPTQYDKEHSPIHTEYCR